MNCLFALSSPSTTFVSKSSAVFQEFVLHFRRDIFVSVKRGGREGSFAVFIAKWCHVAQGLIDSSPTSIQIVAVDSQSSRSLVYRNSKDSVGRDSTMWFDGRPDRPSSVVFSLTFVLRCGYCYRWTSANATIATWNNRRHPYFLRGMRRDYNCSSP